mgnify:CR=1 FL=1
MKRSTQFIVFGVLATTSYVLSSMYLTRRQVFVHNNIRIQSECMVTDNGKIGLRVKKVMNGDSAAKSLEGQVIYHDGYMASTEDVFSDFVSQGCDIDFVGDVDVYPSVTLTHRMFRIRGFSIGRQNP